MVEDGQPTEATSCAVSPWVLDSEFAACLSGECEYMEESLQHMYLAVNEILQSEGESVQRPWLLAQCMAEK